MPANYVKIKLTQVKSLLKGDVIRFGDEPTLGWLLVDSITPKPHNMFEVKVDQGDLENPGLKNYDKKAWAVVEIVKS